jgi:uncharacterized membrane protein YphA (DoxX/SURF4 family)
MLRTGSSKFMSRIYDEQKRNPLIQLFYLSRNRRNTLLVEPSHYLGGFMLVSKELNAGYWALRIAFGLGPLIAGVDKFTNILVNWQKYLSPVAERMLPVSTSTFMHFVGVVEIIVGAAVLLGATRTFGYIAMLWLFAIAANLISGGTYYDIALRDIALGCGAYALARVTEARHSVVLVTDEYPEDYRRAA